MVDYMFMTIKDLAKWLHDHPEREVGFTEDTEEDIEVKGEPTGWYGFMVTKAFGGLGLVAGYYGSGISWAREVEDVSEIEYGITEYLQYEFGINTDENGELCVCRSDI